MASIERTAYPRLKKSFTKPELVEYYTPTQEEIYFVENHAKGDEPQLHLLVLLKTFQKLGYFSSIEAVPPELVNHSAILSLIIAKIDVGSTNQKRSTREIREIREKRKLDPEAL